MAVGILKLTFKVGSATFKLVAIKPVLKSEALYKSWGSFHAN